MALCILWRWCVTDDNDDDSEHNIRRLRSLISPPDLWATAAAETCHWVHAIVYTRCEALSFTLYPVSLQWTCSIRFRYCIQLWTIIIIIIIIITTHRIQSHIQAIKHVHVFNNECSMNISECVIVFIIRAYVFCFVLKLLNLNLKILNTNQTKSQLFFYDMK